MAEMTGQAHTGPARDFVGYGSTPPDPHWPDGADVVINVVVNFEEGAEFNVLDDGANDSWGEYETAFPPEHRDLGTESHFEFGSRVGIWRLAHLFDELEVPFTVAACGRALERNPRFAAWLGESDTDILGHGYRWEGADSPGAPISRAEEASEMDKGIEAITRMTGKAPEGWMVRSFPSVHTRELVAEREGLLYDSDSYNDELPYYVDCLGRPFLVLPYTQLYNDTRYFLAPTYSVPRHFVENLRAALDTLLAESREPGRGKMMSIGLHSRWSGQPSRAWAVREFLTEAKRLPNVRFMRRADIARHWRATHPPPDPTGA
jgi:peptidoglycan/xylan/chitin deacetylase (PgdA/CDA1 family)